MNRRVFMRLAATAIGTLASFYVPGRPWRNVFSDGFKDVKTTMWLGDVDGDITNPCNWSNGVPGNGDSVLVTARAKRDLDCRGQVGISFDNIFIDGRFTKHVYF